MKKVSVLTLLLASLLTGCVEDETTEATRPISEITIIDGTVAEVYNVNKNDTLRIVPQVVQTNEQKPLSYTWEMDLVAVSADEVWEFVGNELGSFNCRLIVENEDGKAFFPFKLNVNSPYEEGLVVISNDAEGNSCLSFMLTPTDDSEKKFYDYECFSVNNRDISFAANVSDMVHCDDNLVIICQGGGQDNDVPSIYSINDKTFVVENMIEVTEYPDFVPVRLGLPPTSSFGTAYPILCANGKTYDYSKFESVIEEPTKMKSTYSNALLLRGDTDSYYYDVLMWDKEAGGLALLYTGYGPYYCSKTYHADRDACIAGDNYFADMNFVSMTYIHQTQKQIATGGGIYEMIVLAKNKTGLTKSVLCTSFHIRNWDIGENVLYERISKKLCGFGTPPLTETTPTIANMTYWSMLFAKGNKVMRWYFTSSAFITAADELLSVGSDKAVITSFEISADHKKTYVAFYEPEQTGLNGSVWVFDTDKGTVLEQYNNVCYEPVKMIYKVK